MPCLNKKRWSSDCLGYPCSWKSSQGDGMNQKITMFNVLAFFLNLFSLPVASSANRKSPLTVELLFSHYFWLWHGWSLSKITLCSSIMPPVILQKRGGGAVLHRPAKWSFDFVTISAHKHIHRYYHVFISNYTLISTLLFSMLSGHWLLTDFWILFTWYPASIW